MRRTLLFLSMAALSVPLGHAGSAAPLQQTVSKDTVVTLERSSCFFGGCPSYTVTISADGDIVFEGRQNVKTLGNAKGHISGDQLEQLIAEFDRANYFALLDLYDGGSKSCPQFLSEAPVATISAQINGRKKTILHDLGCRSTKASETYPPELSELERNIDAIAGTEKWVR